MAFFEWDDSLSVNVKEIDGQHKRIIDMLNNLHEIKGDSKEQIIRVISDLADYAWVHFKTEEDYFDKFNYEEKNSHKMAHQFFVEKVIEFQNNVENDEVDLVSEITEFGKNWLINHIKGIDKGYTKCFNDHGLY